MMDRKGFPESYDTRAPAAVPARPQERRRGGPGAGLQPRRLRHHRRRGGRSCGGPTSSSSRASTCCRSSTRSAEFVSDYFDFSIYVDADEADIREWYVQRFFALRETVFQDPNSFFRHFADLTAEEARATAEGIWARHQRSQPQRQHPADPRAGVADPAQGSRPPRLGRSGSTSSERRPARSGQAAGALAGGCQRPSWMRWWCLEQSGIRFTKSVAPPSRNTVRWWMSQSPQRTGQSRAAQVRCMARRSRRMIGRGQASGSSDIDHPPIATQHDGDHVGVAGQAPHDVGWDWVPVVSRGTRRRRASRRGRFRGR